MRISLFFLAIYLFILFPGMSQAQERKIIIAVPYFQIEGDMAKSYSKTLSDTVITVLQKSGRIETKSKDEIDRIKKEMEELQMYGEKCEAEEKCMARIGKKMQVDYILSPRISKLPDKYVVSLSLISVLAEDKGLPMVPTRQRIIHSEKFILEMVEKMITDLTFEFPLEGKIIKDFGDGQFVLINLGKSHSLKKGDNFFVYKVKKVEKNKDGDILYREMDKVGKLELVDVQARASKAEISSGKNLKEGLLVMLDQEALLKRLKKEREEEEERLKDEVAKKEKEEKENYGRDVSKRSSQEREGRLRKKTDFLRLGYGGPGLGDMVRIADKETDKIYKSGTGFFADLVFGKSIEMYLRGYYKKFEMESTNELTLDPRMTKAPSLSTLTMYGLDYGFRFTIFSGYLFYELWDMYLIGAFRIFNTTKEAADNGVTNTFLSGGVIGGLIFQFTVSPGFGLFAEYNYGYTPVGKTTINVDGHQLYAGINLRVN